MLLRDSLDDAVADVSADLHALTTASRRQGLSIRRRRRALATVGSVAAVTALAMGGYALVSGHSGPDASFATDRAAPVSVGPLSGRTAAATDRGVAAALADAVDEVADGTFGRFQGAVYDHGSFGSLLFQPDGGSGTAGQVMVNVQPLAEAGEAPYTCTGAWFPAMTDCSVRQLPSGDTLRTYWQLDDTEYGAGSQRLAVELLSPERHLLVVINALNTNPWADGAHRDHPVLDLEQATKIATLPWWSRTDLPVEYVEAGKRLEGYSDVAEDAS